MKNKILSGILALSLAICCKSPVEAACFDETSVTSSKILVSATLEDENFISLVTENADQVLEKYDNIIDIREEVLTADESAEYATATETSLVDGTVDEVETFVKFTTIVFEGDSGEETYQIASATAKTSSDSITSNGVTLKGYIGWIDNLGVVNEFRYVSGSRSGDYSGSGYYLALRGTSNLCSGNFDTSFYGTSSLSDLTGTQFRLQVSSPNADGDKTVKLNFTTSILD